jgi:imidazolonepropionase-like amidohydrolase
MSLPAAMRERPVWLRVGTLLDGTAAAPLEDAHVVYDHRQILFVGPASPPRDLLREEQTAPDAHWPEHTLLPGLIDAHTHLFLEGGELDPGTRAAHLQQSPAQLQEQARGRLEKLVRLGVAGMRDAGDKHEVGLALSRLCSEEARPLMPYVDSPGAAIHHRGRYGGFMAEAVEQCGTPEECVAARVRSGSDRIKLIATGVINFAKGAVMTQPQMTAEEVLAFVAAAAARGKQTFAHASGDAGVEAVVEGGVDSVEHGFFVRPDQLARMRDRQIAWTPTFAPVQKQIDAADRLGWDREAIGHLRRILEQHGASLLEAHRAGVTILAGSDAGSYGVPHGLGLVDEMECMEQAGLPAMAVIEAATGAPSRRLAFREKFGQIRPGYRPRFLLTRHSPLAGVANLRKPMTVVFDGAVAADGIAVDARGL